MVTKLVVAPCEGMRIRKDKGAGGPVTTPARPALGPTSPPSPRQLQTLDFIRQYMREHCVAPTRSEIAKSLKVKNVSTVDVHLAGLMKKNWLTLRPRQARYIKLLQEDLPIVRAGPIGPGEHMLAEGRVIDRMAQTVAERFDPAPDCFIKLSDDSMRNAGLMAGDLVAVLASANIAMTGDIVVARSEGEITLRRLRRINEGRIEGIMVGALIGPRRAVSVCADESAIEDSAGTHE